MTITTARPKTGQKRFMDLTKEEMEADLAIATKQAQKEIHAHGLPYIIGDKTGIYNVYPDGKKVFVPYSKE
jgi:hypothetical protein